MTNINILIRNSEIFDEVFDEVQALSYRQLQDELKWFRDEHGATDIPLNSKKRELRHELIMLVYDLVKVPV